MMTRDTSMYRVLTSYSCWEEEETVREVDVEGKVMVCMSVSVSLRVWTTMLLVVIFSFDQSPQNFLCFVFFLLIWRSAKIRAFLGVVISDNTTLWTEEPFRTAADRPISHHCRKELSSAIKEANQKTRAGWEDASDFSSWINKCKRS